MTYYITQSGIRVYPPDMYSFDITLDDIAHHLSKIQRFGGALPLNVFYSVAQHSVALAQVANLKYGPEVARVALFHDTAEAYLGDLISPLKRCLPQFEELEQQLERRIYKKYNLLYNNFHTIMEVVKTLDRAILLTEVATFLPNYMKSFVNSVEEHLLEVVLKEEKDQNETKHLFLQWCKKLGVSDARTDTTFRS